MTAEGSILIVDKNAIIDLWEAGGEAAWDTMLASGRKTIVPGEVYRELQLIPETLSDGRPTPYYDLIAKFETWRQKSGVVNLSEIVPGQSGDAAIQQLALREDANAIAALRDAGIADNSLFRVLSDDQGVKNRLANVTRNFKPDVLTALNLSEPYEGIGEFLRERGALDEISPETLNRWYRKFETSIRFTGDRSIGQGPALSKRYLAEILPESQILDDSIWSKIKGLFADKRGSVDPHFALKGGILAGAGALAAKFGLIGDVLAFAATASLADELRAQGKKSEANELWVEYAYQTGGGVIGSILGAAAAAYASKGAGGFWAPLVGGLVGGVAGSLIGAPVGRFLYESNPEFFDSFIDPIYEGFDGFSLDSGLNEDGTFDLDSVAMQIFRKLGFQLDQSQGSAASDWLLATKWQNVGGAGGDDILLGWRPEALEAGQVFNAALHTQAQAQWAAYDAAHAAWVASGGQGDAPVEPTLDRNAGVATNELRQILDGGQGNDLVIAIGGEKAITAGGLGRDWIYNTSSGGEIWGDVKGSVNLGGGHYAYFENGHQVDIADGHDNADNFWYAPDVTIMDAQHSDVLKFYGLPLTGGDANGGLMGLGIGGLAGASIGLANQALGNISDWTKGIYFDHLFPWMSYQFQRNADGNLDLYITNQFDQVFRAFFSIPGFTDAPSDGPLHGYMKVANVDVVGSRLGSLQFGLEDQGSLGMVFRAVNPLQMLLPILNLVPGAIGAALYYSVYADTLASTAAAISRAAKAAKWSSGGDPLVIDLDGDGIEAISLDSSNTYFDVDGDLFRERTGWLKGDDGFLVLDVNGNGRVDDISEMFGNRFQGGYDELATYDSNGDGKFLIADAVWARLKVRHDKGRDGRSGMGMLWAGNGNWRTQNAREAA